MSQQRHAVVQKQTACWGEEREVAHWGSGVSAPAGAFSGLDWKMQFWASSKKYESKGREAELSDTGQITALREELGFTHAGKPEGRRETCSPNAECVCREGGGKPFAVSFGDKRGSSEVNWMER